MSVAHVACALGLILGPGHVEGSCDIETTGIETARVESLLVALKKALAAQDMDAITTLFRYPLVVNSREPHYRTPRTTEVPAPDVLVARFRDALLGRLRSEAARWSLSDTVCLPGSVGLGHAVAWASDKNGSLLIDAINSDALQWPGMESEPVLRCRTREQNVLIYYAGRRLRAQWWPRHSGNTKVGKRSAPAVERIEGSGTCRSRIWTIDDNGIEVVANEGCPAEPNRRLRAWIMEDGNRSGEEVVREPCYAY